MIKTAVITGGTRGIGLACAEKMYSLGYNTAIIYKKNDSKADDFLKGKDLSRVLAIKADISDYEETQNAFSTIKDKFVSIDILVNNAGIAEQKMINDITPSDWDTMFSTNTKGVYNCVKASLDCMLHNKWGRIINISSVWGVCGASCETHYSASKSAVIGFTKALAKELGPSGITVNCIAPGVIDTDMNSHLDLQTINNLKYETPLMRIGSADDVAETVAFFSSDTASFITGQVLCVDGGFSL